MHYYSAFIINPFIKRGVLPATVAFSVLEYKKHIKTSRMILFWNNVYATNLLSWEHWA